MTKQSSFIAAEKNLPELTLRCIVIAILLTIVLAMANAYLALKIGILTSASIPAAILSMSILRFFKDSNILENNLVQTAASAGEAVAGGIVYTIPALIIIQYWTHFSYFENVLIALIGGGLGVLFSIPLRKVLVNDKRLNFPEGRAVAEVLKTQTQGSVKEILMGGMVGGLLEFLQTGLKVLASDWQFSFQVKKLLFGFGFGFSSTMIGAGYLVGFEMAFSILLGAIISGLVALPLTSYLFPYYLNSHSHYEALGLLMTSKVRYIGIGAMLFAGIWTFSTLIKPLIAGLKRGIRLVLVGRFGSSEDLRTERDLPLLFNLAGVILLSIMLFFFFMEIFPISQIGFSHAFSMPFVLIAIFYVLVIGFIFAAITGYFSGMVGVTASPGSSIIIAGMLMVASMLFFAMKKFLGLTFSTHQLQAAEAITIIIGAVVTGIAAIANDNSQDLKVGHIIGATPWKQQLMLLLGVLVSSLVIPPIMQLLFDVYGIAGVLPHPGMDINQSLPAPPAALMAAVTKGVFQQDLPWQLLELGCAIALIVVMVNALLSSLNQSFKLSILGVAVGIYLPSSSSIPLFLGGLIALLVERRLHKRSFKDATKKARAHRGVLIACGIVAGAAIMDVLLAIPFSIIGSPDALKLSIANFDSSAIILAFITVLALFIWIRQVVCFND